MTRWRCRSSRIEFSLVPRQRLDRTHKRLSTLDVISSFMPDVCFIDVEMPELNGLQLVSIIRSNPKFEKMSIAMLSSAASIFEPQKGLIAGADLYITNPSRKTAFSEPWKRWRGCMNNEASKTKGSLPFAWATPCACARLRIWMRFLLRP